MKITRTNTHPNMHNIIYQTPDLEIEYCVERYSILAFKLMKSVTGKYFDTKLKKDYYCQKF